MILGVPIGEAAKHSGVKVPTIRYYDLHPLWILTLAPAACLFLAMTWTSAWRYWTGERSRWKSRSYDKIEGH
mgnify:CR=1 FL=1